MKNFWIPEGRKIFFFRHPPRGSLPHTILLLLFSLLAYPAFTVSSCTSGSSVPEEPPDEYAPETLFISDPGTEVFVYSATGRPLLEKHFIIPPDGDTLVRTGEGDKIAVGIADSPYGIRLDAVENYESMELLRVDFKDDDPEKPLRSATAQFCGGDCVMLEPEALMCRVELRSVLNESGALLVSPRVRLSNANPFVEILRESGFRMTEGGVDLPWTPLPCDVGLYALYPGTVLHCYPNDAPDVGSPAMRLCFESVCSGDTLRLENKLPPLGRGGSMTIDIFVDRNLGLSTEVVVKDIFRSDSE